MSWYYYYSDFTDGETGTQRDSKDSVAIEGQTQKSDSKAFVLSPFYIKSATWMSSGEVEPGEGVGEGAE